MSVCPVQLLYVTPVLDTGLHGDAIVSTTQTDTVAAPSAEPGRTVHFYTTQVSDENNRHGHGATYVRCRW